MIYITGDTHADFSRFLIENFPIQNEMTKYDYVIICGTLVEFGHLKKKTYKKSIGWII